ncbi:MAG: hypothetical protein L3J30_04380 [Marinosulfonomonas sp.]|nr:hypothetical protein [Marinosulfonomonas sp.]
MKLDEFIEKSLLDITNGVAAAQRATKLYIAPGWVENTTLTEPQFVSFELAVTISKEAGGGISVFSMGDVKAKGNSEKTHRISFDVPVYFQAPTERNDMHFSKKKDKGESNS